jgi:ABC-type transport system involved in multi-copper enzyme maturation permease subunit
MRGIIRAEILRLRKRNALILIMIAVPLLAAMFFGLGYASIFDPPPFDPVRLRQEAIDFGYAEGVPPDQVEQYLDEYIAQAERDHVMQVEGAKQTRAMYALPQSLVTILGNSMFVLLALALLTATTVGDEFGWGTIRTTLLGSSHRWRILLVRLGALWLVSALILVLMLAVGALAPIFLGVADRPLPSPVPPVDFGALAILVLGILLACLGVIAFATLATVIVRNGALTLVSVLVYVVVEAAILALLMRFKAFGYDFENQRPGELAWTLDALPAHGFVTLMDVGAGAARAFLYLGQFQVEGQKLPAIGDVTLAVVAFAAWGALFGLLALWRFGRMDIVE